MIPFFLFFFQWCHWHTMLWIYYNESTSKYLLMMEESNKRGHGKERRMMGIHHVYIYVLSFLLATPFHFIAFILHTFSFIHSACLWGNLRIGNVRWLRTRWASVSFLFNLYTRQQIVVLVLVIIENLFIYWFAILPHNI